MVNGIGAYSGAYKKYETLQLGFYDFLTKKDDAVVTKKWHVLLDNDTLELEQSPQFILNDLQQNGRDFGFCFMRNNPYLLAFGNGSNPYQMALKRVQEYKSIIPYKANPNYTVAFIEGFSELNNDLFNSYDNIFDTTNFKENIFIVAILPNGEKKYYQPELDETGLFRVRRLIEA